MDFNLPSAHIIEEKSNYYDILNIIERQRALGFISFS